MVLSDESMMAMGASEPVHFCSLTCYGYNLQFAVEPSPQLGHLTQSFFYGVTLLLCLEIPVHIAQWILQLSVKKWSLKFH